MLGEERKDRMKDEKKNNWDRNRTGGNKGKVRRGNTGRGEKVAEKRTEKRQIRRGGGEKDEPKGVKRRREEKRAGRTEEGWSQTELTLREEEQQQTGEIRGKKEEVNSLGKSLGGERQSGRTRRAQRTGEMLDGEILGTEGGRVRGERTRRGGKTGAKRNIGVMIKTLGMRTRGSRARGAQRNHKRGQERTPPEMSQ